MSLQNSQTLWRACAGSLLGPAAGASASVLVCVATQLVGTSLTCEKVCWQEVFLCLNEHWVMSAFLQASLISSLLICFALTSLLNSATSSRVSGCFTKGCKYYPCVKKQRDRTNGWFEHRFSSPQLFLHHYKVHKEQEAGLAQKPACLQEGGQAIAQQCEG